MAKKSFDHSMSISGGKIKVVTVSYASKGVPGRQAKWEFVRFFKNIPDADAFVRRVRSATLTGSGYPVNHRALAAIGQFGVRALGSTHGRNYYQGPDRDLSFRFGARR